MFFNVKKLYFLTLKNICSIEFFENKELQGQVDIFTPANLKKNLPKETREIAEKRWKIQ